VEKTKNKELERMIKELGQAKYDALIAARMDPSKISVDKCGMEEVQRMAKVSTLEAVYNWRRRGFVAAKRAMAIEVNSDGEYDAVLLAGRR
jgi:hypothetical protein